MLPQVEKEMTCTVQTKPDVVYNEIITHTIKAEAALCRMDLSREWKAVDNSTTLGCFV